MGRGRAPCCDKSKVRKGPWSPAEDMRLVSYIKKHGHANWRALPKHAGLLRCGKSCRLRWINYLRPDIKRGNFTSDEEQLVINLHRSLGNKWSKIAAHLPGRTDNEIKNVWNAHIKKKLRGSVTVSATGDSLVTGSKPSSSGTAIQELGFSETLTVNDDDDVKKQAAATSDDGSPVSDSPTSSYASNFMAVPENNNISVEKIEIPFEPDVDYWELLDPLSEPGRNVGNQESRREIGEDDYYRQWLRRLENELGLRNEVESQSMDQSSITVTQQVQVQDPDQWNCLPLWPSSPSHLWL